MKYVHENHKHVYYLSNGLYGHTIRQLDTETGIRGSKLELDRDGYEKFLEMMHTNGWKEQPNFQGDDMSNQRGGTWNKASASNAIDDARAMKLRNFFRDAKELLEKNGNEDAAYYFEQVMDELNQGKSLPTEKENVSRLLGL